jgi:tetratricopeptide (TPR) repeat protein
MAKKKLSAEKQQLISASDGSFYLTTILLAQRYLQTHPDDFRALLDLGFACTQLSRFQEARAAFVRALDADPDETDVVYGLLGNCLRIQGELPPAIDCFRKQIEVAPTDATGYVNLGSLLFRSGEFSEAEEVLEQGKNCQTGLMADVFYTLGVVLLAQEKIRPALEALQKAAQLDPHNSEIQKALKDARKAASLFGN